MPHLDCDEQTLLIWDADDVPPSHIVMLAFWKSYEPPEMPQTWTSVPALVEKKSDELKQHFLAWLYDLGEAKLKNERLVDHLELRKDFSYWWMTSLVEKNYGKSKAFYNAIRLLALEEMLKKLKLQQIIFVSDDPDVAACIKILCLRLSLKFKWKKSCRSKLTKVNVKKYITRMAPQPLRSMAYFIKKAFAFNAIRDNGRQFKSQTDDSIMFVDYLAHLNGDVTEQGQFSSNYWTELITLVRMKDQKTHWLHHYVKHSAVPTPKKANQLMAQFNQADELHSHSYVGSEITLHMLYKVLLDYVVLFYRSFYLRKIKKYFSPSHSSLDLWPLFKTDWLSSMRGSVAMSNCFMLNIFEAFLSQVPIQKKGLYLQENAPWEMAFIYAWKAFGHGELIGVPHSTIRYWDLRYFHDPRCYVQKEKNKLPMPDWVAVNGLIARKTYLNGGYPVDKVFGVEALRYLYLMQIMPSKFKKERSCSKIRLLICGDIFDDLNKKMMRCLELAIHNNSSRYSCTLKSHPLNKIALKNYPLLAAYETTASLDGLLQEQDVVFTSNNTSAAVDAYCAGLPVIQMLDGSTFNASPLRSISSVMYVKNASELADTLAGICGAKPVISEEYFYLDEKLPRWSRLLNFDKVLCEGSND